MIPLELLEEIIKGTPPTLFLYTNSPMGTNTPTSSRLAVFRQKILSAKNQHKCIQLGFLICLPPIINFLMPKLETKNPIDVD